MLKIHIFRYVTPVFRYIMTINSIHIITVLRSTLRDIKDDKNHIITYRRSRTAVVYITLPAVAVIRKIFGTENCYIAFNKQVTQLPTTTKPSTDVRLLISTGLQLSLITSRKPRNEPGSVINTDRRYVPRWLC